MRKIVKRSIQAKDGILKGFDIGLTLGRLSRWLRIRMDSRLRLDISVPNRGSISPKRTCFARRVAGAGGRSSRLFGTGGGRWPWDRAPDVLVRPHRKLEALKIDPKTGISVLFSFEVDTIELICFGYIIICMFIEPGCSICCVATSC